MPCFALYPIMNLPDFKMLYDASGGLLHVAFAGSLFAFFSKPKTEIFSNQKLQEISHAVQKFLESKEVTNFKVYTILCEDNPVVLVQAEPQKKLRFSNILEAQVRNFLSEELAVEVPAVFWRFKSNAQNEAEPEQASYVFEESPQYPADQAPALAAAASEVKSAAKEEPRKETEKRPVAESRDQDLYDLQSTTRRMHVEEISMSEFDAFLKGDGGKNSP